MRLSVREVEIRLGTIEVQQLPRTLSNEHEAGKWNQAAEAPQRKRLLLEDKWWLKSAALGKTKLPHRMNLRKYDTLTDVT